MTFNSQGYAVDLFSQIASGVRIIQKAPELERTYDECATFSDRTEQYPSTEEQIDGTVPSWFVGLGIHLVLAAGALWWAIARTHTPARRLARGTRIA